LIRKLFDNKNIHKILQFAIKLVSEIFGKRAKSRTSKLQKARTLKLKTGKSQKIESLIDLPIFN
jgi:hypothetical protein